jgi:hypothetical protein
VAKPKVGERRVTVTHITDFIEKKLSIEFQVILSVLLMEKTGVPGKNHRPVASH